MEEIEFDGTEFTIGSSNVFADLELPDAEERQLKANLSIEIELAIKKRHLTKQQAAALLGLSPDQFSLLLGRGFADFSISQVVSFLHCLGRDVTLSASVRERVPKVAETVLQEEQVAALA